MKKPIGTNARSEQASLALHLLDLTREETAKAKRNRKYYAGLARDHGLTFREIGTALGISEAAVRLILTPAES